VRKGGSMDRERTVPVWWIMVNDRVVDGPYFLQAAAYMRLAEFPNGRVVRGERIVEGVR